MTISRRSLAEADRLTGGQADRRTGGQEDRQGISLPLIRHAQPPSWREMRSVHAKQCDRYRTSKRERRRNRQAGPFNSTAFKKFIGSRFCCRFFGVFFFCCCNCAVSVEKVYVKVYGAVRGAEPPIVGINTLCEGAVRGAELTGIGMSRR